jgi:hypothetical protein
MLDNVIRLFNFLLEYLMATGSLVALYSTPDYLYT